MSMRVYVYSMSDKRLSAEGYQRAAAKFKVLAEPTRLRILDILREHQGLSVSEVGHELELSQPTASRQLGRLYEARLIARRRENNTVIYFIEDESIFQLCAAVCGRIEREVEKDRDALYVPARSAHS